MIRRVLIVNLWDKSGMLHYAVQLANALSVRMTVILVLPETTPDSRIRELGVSSEVQIEKVPALTENPPDARNVFRQFGAMYAFIRRVHEIDPDIIHVSAAHFWLIFTLPFLYRRFPIVSTIHDIEPHPGLDNTVRKRMEIWAQVRFSRHVFVHGDALRSKMMARISKREGGWISVVPHGDYAFFRELNGGLISEEPGTVLFFGRIRAYKGLEVLLRSFRRIKNTLPSARLIIAGEGSISESVMEEISEHGYELHNRFIPDSEVSGFFRRASIVVCPYIEASQSGVVPIAYAFKKPVVVTRTGSLPEIVADGVSGLVVPPGDVEKLAEAICLLLQDKALRKRLGEGGDQKMRAEMSWTAITTATAAVYERLAA